jgi:hypothetical protein
MIKIIIIILLIYLIYKIPHFIEPFSKEETLDALERYPDKSIDPLYDASFKPECCPSIYSSSSGCLCDEPQNLNVIATRGGNILSQTFINTYSNNCAQSF